MHCSFRISLQRLRFGVGGALRAYRSGIHTCAPPCATISIVSGENLTSRMVTAVTVAVISCVGAGAVTVAACATGADSRLTDSAARVPSRLICLPWRKPPIKITMAQNASVLNDTGPETTLTVFASKSTAGISLETGRFFVVNALPM